MPARERDQINCTLSRGLVKRCLGNGDLRMVINLRSIDTNVFKTGSRERLLKSWPKVGGQSATVAQEAERGGW